MFLGLECCRPQDFIRHVPSVTFSCRGKCLKLWGIKKRLRLDEDLKRHFVSDGVQAGAFRSASQGVRQAGLWKPTNKKKQKSCQGAAIRWQNEDLQAYMACCHEQLSDVTCRMYEHILAELFLIPWRATRDT